MIFFSIGLPGPLVEWCDAVIARLVEHSYGLGDIDTWWSSFEEPKRTIAIGALDGYVEHFAGRGLGKLLWSRDLFFVGDDPQQTADGPIDITGRVRNLVFGPYMILPPGSWVAA